ncbi:putative transcriptional regulatory protein [Fulvia fulva]|uniref:Transcriptional regulatory protein n=1 Tax=Passalora fulva TaxID=5499 RepID=A0A9Q8P516_PASFU|nr:putative transcriptional regulatory protein [Fulvia fulva]KAK4631137.1 putative transcriptional regulatory protein [Fulvia fulva]KAK4632943.1 putative transcriptional regulatory protein [Fulvia fulva]UJO13665.1 putative transcriptional regulatory protein [Fulvia fulva]WPV11615.1 putative transcriptional regulatory protein [Fulvia fulva]WPV25890.1 putative transcriptional regulatory protein [Fulvia fulva]
MAPSRGLHSLDLIHRPYQRYLCSQCRTRSFATTPTSLSGHSRWSKIKHDKAKTDSSKNKARSIFSHEIATASRLFGPDPNMNPRLADIITKAKRESFAKASIEAAIARGQGRSLSGHALESVTVEGLLPNNVAVIVECETDGKLRTLAEVRLVIKEAGGSEGKTGYLFTKRGRVVFEAKEGVGMDDVLEPALEAGAQDVTEDDDGKFVVWTEPGDTKHVGEAMTEALSLQIATSDIVSVPNEDTKVAVPSEEAAGELRHFIDQLQEKEASVQSIAMNVSQGNLEADAWNDLRSRLGAS